MNLSKPYVVLLNGRIEGEFLKCESAVKFIRGNPGMEASVLLEVLPHPLRGEDFQHLLKKCEKRKRQKT